MSGQDTMKGSRALALAPAPAPVLALTRALALALVVALALAPALVIALALVTLWLVATACMAYTPPLHIVVGSSWSHYGWCSCRRRAHQRHSNPHRCFPQG